MKEWKIERKKEWMNERKNKRKKEWNNERKIERKKIERKNPVLNDLQIGNNHTREQTHIKCTGN